ncbi:MAG: ABC transporter substrate-binding protein [Candidatus Freyarchaeum deiterrae]
MKELRVGYLPTMYHTSYVLKSGGWLEEQLKRIVDWRLYPTGPAMTKAFGDRDIDIGYIGLPPAMIAIDRGVPIICVAGGHVEGTVMLATEDYKSLEELKEARKVLEQFQDKKIGTPTRGSIHDVIIRDLLEKLDLTGATVENYEWAELLPEALENGEIQAAVGTPALFVAASQRLDVKLVMPPNRLWPNNPSYGILVRKELEDEAQVIMEFLKMHKKACALIRENPKQAAKLVSKEMKGVSVDFVKKMYAVSPKYCAMLSREYMESTMAFVPVLKKLGYLKKALEEKDVFKPDYIKKVHPEAPHY